MEWKLEYGFILFIAFAGVTYRITQETKSGNILRRLYAQFYAWLITCLVCVGLFASMLHWHVVWCCIDAALLSPVMERGIWLWMEQQNSSSSFMQYVKRFRKTMREMEKEEDEKL